MAPTFDEDNSRDRLRSLWDAGQDLTITAAHRGELEAALEAAQREYEAALATRSALLTALAAVQSAYTAAHLKAVAVGWSSTELSEAGLPSPAARHSGSRGRDRRNTAAAPDASAIAAAATPAVAPPVVPAVATSAPPVVPAPAVPTSSARSRSTSRPTTTPAVPTSTPGPSRADQRSSWDTQQTAFLVTSRSKDNPVWYESMRRSRISPSTDDATALDGLDWQGPPAPTDE